MYLTVLTILWSTTEGVIFIIFIFYLHSTILDLTYSWFILRDELPLLSHLLWFFKNYVNGNHGHIERENPDKTTFYYSSVVLCLGMKNRFSLPTTILLSIWTNQHEWMHIWMLRNQEATFLLCYYKNNPCNAHQQLFSFTKHLLVVTMAADAYKWPQLLSS